MGLLESIVFGILSLVGFFIDLMPSFPNLGNIFESPFSYFRQVMINSSALLPVQDIFYCLTPFLIIKTTMFTMYLVNYVIKVVRDLAP